MARRYFSVFKTHFYLLAVLIVLVVISSVTIGLISTITSIMAGLVMIIFGIAMTLWILKTPAKRTNEEGISI